MWLVRTHIGSYWRCNLEVQGRPDPNSDPGQGTDQGQGPGLLRITKMKTQKSIAPGCGDCEWPAFVESILRQQNQPRTHWITFIEEYMQESLSLLVPIRYKRNARFLCWMDINGELPKARHPNPVPRRTRRPAFAIAFACTFACAFAVTPPPPPSFVL